MIAAAARPTWRWVVPGLLHLPVVAWVFSGALFAGQVPYFRDVLVYYYPNYVFLERSLRQGVWPLWNPTSDAGAPFLVADPIDLVLVGLLGALGALRFGPPLHLALAMVGCSRLAATLGMGRLGAWAAGLFYGLSGYVLSTANLFQPFHATAWAPWVLAAGLRMWASPSPRGVAVLASLAAVQVSTLGAETVVQTALVGVFLLTGRPDRRRLGAGIVAALVALLLAAPALLGARALVLGTARAEGFSPLQSFAHSLSPVALVDTVFPRFFGDVHTFSEVGYWGQPFFPSGYPYLLSLYWGLGVLWLAAWSGPFPARRRLVGLGVLGVLLALGSHGPLEWLLAPLMRSFRAPSKFLFLTTLAACLLAGAGLQRARRESKPGFALPGLVAAAFLLGLALVTRVSPDLPGQVFGGVLPELLDPRALFVIRTAWPAALGVSGVLLLGAAVASRSRALAPLAGILIGLDLLLVNGQVNLTTSPTFYDLRPDVARLLEPARGKGAWRFFAYGAGEVPGLRWAEEVARRNSDVWLYYVDRQALVPRTHVIDGLEGAFDEDRAGWAPPGSVLNARERTASRYREHHARLRLANVRFVLSFRVLPDDLVRLVGEAQLPEVREPLRLFELRDPLPRAFRTDRLELVPDRDELGQRLSSPEFDPRGIALVETPPGTLPDGSAEAAGEGPGEVRYELEDAHTVRLESHGPPGWVVVLDGHHPDWRAYANGAPRPLLRADGRYRAVATRGGGEVLTLRYEPSWRRAALLACALGAALVIGLAGHGVVARQGPPRPPDLKSAGAHLA